MNIMIQHIRKSHILPCTTDGSAQQKWQNLMFAIPKCLTHMGINIQWCVSQTQQNFITFIIVLGQYVSILTESSSGPSKKTDPYLKCIFYIVLSRM